MATISGTEKGMTSAVFDLRERIRIFELADLYRLDRERVMTEVERRLLITTGRFDGALAVIEGRLRRHLYPEEYKLPPLETCPNCYAVKGHCGEDCRAFPAEPMIPPDMQGWLQNGEVVHRALMTEEHVDKANELLTEPKAERWLAVCADRCRKCKKLPQFTRYSATNHKIGCGCHAVTAKTTNQARASWNVRFGENAADDPIERSKRIKGMRADMRIVDDPLEPGHKQDPEALKKMREWYDKEIRGSMLGAPVLLPRPGVDIKEARSLAPLAPPLPLHFISVNVSVDGSEADSFAIGDKIKAEPDAGNLPEKQSDMPPPEPITVLLDPGGDFHIASLNNQKYGPDEIDRAEGAALDGIGKDHNLARRLLDDETEIPERDHDYRRRIRMEWFKWEIDSLKDLIGSGLETVARWYDLGRWYRHGKREGDVMLRNRIELAMLSAQKGNSKHLASR